MLKNFLFIFFAFTTLSGICQTAPDTLNVVQEPAQEPEVPRNHSPRKAAILSAVIPGLGQVYNGGKQWIKVPFIYAGLGTTTYFVFENHRLYQEARDRIEQTTDPVDRDELRLDRDYYRRNRDFSVILTGIVYALNIVDANVFAHMKNFRVSPDLSLNVNPFFYTANRSNLATGLTFSLTYK